MYCEDPYTKLQKGDLGTIKWQRLDDLWGDTVTAVNWDSGSTLSLIEGKDNFVLLPELEEDIVVVRGKRVDERIERI